MKFTSSTLTVVEEKKSTTNIAIVAKETFVNSQVHDLDHGSVKVHKTVSFLSL